MLRQIAIRLGGTYHNGNTQHVSTDLLKAISASGEVSALDRLTRREYALIACGLGGLILALLPLALQRFGVAWVPGVPEYSCRPRSPGQPANTGHRPGLRRYDRKTVRPDAIV